MIAFSTGANHKQQYNFGRLSWDELVQLAQNPEDLSSTVVMAASVKEQVEQSIKAVKSRTRWVIPSDCSSKTKAEMEAHGRYGMLVIDVDAGNHDIEVIGWYLNALGIKRFIVYSTLSATSNNRRWRVLIVLAETVCVDVWNELSLYLFHMIPDADDCTSRSQQISYLPTKSLLNKDCYEFIGQNGIALDPFNSQMATATKQLKPHIENVLKSNAWARRRK
ncbi:hypothetical protein [Vibrio mediterranei]|uniref:hypothetical protein n=1 Tax=Vibrio mediterranei TaxID=689 RepID=UPI0022834B65|nr:hypothetical protein [Vibrio mediterranei]MCY9855311.1 hypothetical protein [Vibrio mediterranei]